MLAIACGGDGPSPTPSPAPSPAVVLPSPTPEPTPTAEPTPTTGSPFALVDVQATWEARGVTATLGGPNAGFSGFGTTAFDARLIRGEDSMELSILVYADIEVIKEDWELTVGESPMPNEGRDVPDHISIWWKENIVVVVRSSVGALSSDALDAFLALGEGSVRQLAYVGADGGIRLVNADGSWQTRFADVCGAENRREATRLAWSPSGDKLAVGCVNRTNSTKHSLFVLDGEGHTLNRLEGVALRFRWSPDGERLAYQTNEFFTSQPPRYRVRTLDLATLEEEGVSEDALLLEWPLLDRMLVGLSVEQSVSGPPLYSYDAHWLDLNSGQTQPIHRFDDSRQFWLAPDGGKAVVLAGPASREEGGGRLAIFDLETGVEQPIPGSGIGYPSEGIPFWQLAISADGTKFYWADASSSPTLIYRANMDGSGLTRLGTVPSVIAYVSGASLVAYPAAGKPATIIVEDLEAGIRAEVGEGFASMAWRPTP